MLPHYVLDAICVRDHNMLSVVSYVIEIGRRVGGGKEGERASLGSSEDDKAACRTEQCHGNGFCEGGQTVDTVSHGSAERTSCIMRKNG